MTDQPEGYPHPCTFSTDQFCIRCGRKLEHDDIGLHRKLVNRGAKEFLCRQCLAEKFKMSVEDCNHLIAHYRETGCMLFN